MKNYTTPRTLADAEFRVGYPVIVHRISTIERIADHALAVAIGVISAVGLIHYLAR